MFDGSRTTHLVFYPAVSQDTQVSLVNPFILITQVSLVTLVSLVTPVSLLILESVKQPRPAVSTPSVQSLLLRLLCMILKLSWVMGRPGPQSSTSSFSSEIRCSEAFRPTRSSSESTPYLLRSVFKLLKLGHLEFKKIEVNFK